MEIVHNLYVELMEVLKDKKEDYKKTVTAVEVCAIRLGHKYMSCDDVKLKKLVGSIMLGDKNKR